jgi:hypothetical protein
MEHVMNTKVALETDFIQLLARLISEGDDNDPPIPRTGKNLMCSQPVLGRWFDDCDFPFLMETLALPDHVFSLEYPEIHLSLEERQAFASALQTHSRECAHCHAAKTEDIEWKQRVDKAFDKNKRLIGALLIDSVDEP